MDDFIEVDFLIDRLAPDTTPYKLYGTSLSPHKDLSVRVNVPTVYVKESSPRTILSLEGYRWVLNVLASQTDLANLERPGFTKFQGDENASNN